MRKLDKKWLSQQQIRNAIGNASAAPCKLNNMIGSITGNERRPTCRGRYKANTQKYYASMLYEIYARSNECTCEYGTFKGKSKANIQAKSKANIQANRIVRVVMQSC